MPRMSQPPPSSKAPARSQVEMTEIVLPPDANALGTAFGGRIMQWIDVAAGVAARRHAGRVAVTAAMDSLRFLVPIRLGDVVVLRAAVNRTWRTSMEVGVRVEFERESEEERTHAASAYLTFVAIDAEGRPQAVPALAPETEVERRRYAEAEQRRLVRLQQRKR